MIDPDSDPTVSASEAARMMRISSQRVRKLIADNKLPARLIYGQWRIPREAVEARIEWLRGGGGKKGRRPTTE